MSEVEESGKKRKRPYVKPEIKIYPFDKEYDPFDRCPGGCIGMRSGCSNFIDSVLFQKNESVNPSK